MSVLCILPTSIDVWPTSIDRQIEYCDQREVRHIIVLFFASLNQPQILLVSNHAPLVLACSLNEVLISQKLNHL